MKTVLTIAGSDSSGGAGIQADIKTMTMNGVYAMSAITALTAQNTMGVKGVLETPAGFLKLQLESIFEDIYPDAIKIGMVSSSELITVIAKCLKKYQARNIVVDPVMVATSGSKLLNDNAIETLIHTLFPLATVITPNIPEAKILTGIEIYDQQDMIKSASMMYEQYGCAILLKGGHAVNDANDLLYLGNRYRWVKGKRIENPNTHGTGCTLSSAIASNLGKGFNLEDSISRSKKYISGALEAMLDLGKGSGPMEHNFNLKGMYAKEVR